MQKSNSSFKIFVILFIVTTTIMMTKYMAYKIFCILFDIIGGARHFDVGSLEISDKRGGRAPG